MAQAGQQACWHQLPAGPGRRPSTAPGAMASPTSDSDTEADIQGDIFDMLHVGESLADTLIASGCLKTAASIQPFRAVDRKDFLPEESEDLAYIDAPVREGKLHQSSPSVYAKALE